MSSKIEWTDETWNPVTGCSPISEGCKNCYARRMANRLRGRFGYPADDPFRVTVHEDKLETPLKWRKPRRVFVCSMGDLFHEDVPFDIQIVVLNIIRMCPQHTFQILTKRPKEMNEVIRVSILPGHKEMLKNLWLGVTAENQRCWDERVPILLDSPAAVRFVSCEPLLGSIRAELPSQFMAPEIRPIGPDWIICGGETGPHARPMHPDWPRSLRDQAIKAGIPFFFKQWGAWIRRQEYQEHDPTASGWAELLIRSKTMALNGDLFVKVKAERLLNGREWNEFPEVTHES